MSKATLLKSTVQQTNPESTTETAPAPRRRPVDMRLPLSVRERARKEQLEAVVIGNFKAFYEVGCALRSIREEGLYRESHKTFEHYAKQLFDIAKSRAYQLIDAANAVENVHNCGQGAGFEADDPALIEWLPMNEAQARALVGLTPEQQAEVWAAAVGTAKDGRITAAHVKRTRQKYTGEKIQQAINAATRPDPEDPEKLMSADFKAAFDAFIDQINIARLEKFKHTSKFNVIRILVGVTKAIAGNEDVGMIFGLRNPEA